MSEIKQGMARMNLDLKRGLYARFIRAFPHGTRSDIQRTLIKMAVEAVEESGSLMIGALLSGEVGICYKPKSVPSAIDAKRGEDGKDEG